MPPVRTFAAQKLNDLEAAAGTQAPWLWDGYLAPGNVTLLTSQWKSAAAAPVPGFRRDPAT